MNQTQFFYAIDTAINVRTMQYLNAMLDEFRSELIQEYPDVAPMIDDLINIYRYPIRTTLKLEIHQRKKKSEVAQDKKCLARIGLGKQCSRPHMLNSEFCRSHKENIQYGRIDGPEIEHQILKKRGRQAKTKHINTEDLDLNKYIQAIRIKINNELYLVDEHDIVYKHTPDNEIVGRLSGDVINWF